VEIKSLNPNLIEVNDPIVDSPVGRGIVTGVTDAGFPQVNHVAVAWLQRADGAFFDPHNRNGGSKPPLVTGKTARIFKIYNADRHAETSVIS
jgi:hypothetical protein